MADNTELNAGTGGDTIASDDIGGIKHQRVKIQHGADGSATDVSTASPLPIGGSAAEDAAASGNPVLSGGRYDSTKRTLDTGDVGSIALNANGEPIVDIGNTVSSVNSSTTPLGISGVFTGTGEDISKYAAVNIMIFADEDSAANGLSVEFSSDNSNWDEVETHTVTASTTFVTQAMGEGNYFRIVYTNGATGQSAFRLHVIYKVIPSIGEVGHLDVAISDSGDAQLTRSVLAGKNPGGSYENIGITTGGNLKVSIEEADTSASGLAKAEDAVHSSGDVGVMPLAVRNDVLAALAGTDGDYAPIQVNADGAIWCLQAPNVIDANNSTTTPLANDAVYTGTGADVLGYSAVTIQLDSTHDSATDGMTFQFSSDNSNWDSVHNFTYTAADSGRNFQFAAHARYFRIVYTNGGTTQTTFRVQTILHRTTPITTIHRLIDNTDPDRSATLQKSVTIAQAAGSGDFIPVQATASGNFKVAIEEISDGLDIGAGNAGAETQRVSISTDDVNLSAIKTAVEIMDDWDETDRAKVNIIAGQVGIAGGAGVDGATVPRVSLATDTPLPAGTNAIGKLTANNGVDIGDVDITSQIPGVGATNLGKAQDSAGGATDTGVAMLAIRDDEQAAMTPADGDYSTLRTDKFGNLKTTQLPDATSEVKFGVINASSSGDNTLQAAAGAGIKIRVLSLFMVSAGTVNARIESGAGGTAMTGQMPLIANSGFSLAYNPAGWFETADNALLNLELSAAIGVHGSFSYVEV